MTYSEREREFTFANKMSFNLLSIYSYCLPWQLSVADRCGCVCMSTDGAFILLRISGFGCRPVPYVALKVRYHSASC